MLALGLSSAPAVADSLIVDPLVNTERSYIPFEELSYELIVEGMVGFRADLRLRTALHNHSAREQDMVLSLALPRGAEIHGLRVARAGEWHEGIATKLAGEPGRSDPGTIFVRQLPPEERGDLPGAELVAFSLAPGSTTQIELQLLVPPRMRGDRWELTLPERGESPLGLARQRRVIVHNAREFWVNDESNHQGTTQQPMLPSRASDRVILAWPATPSQSDGRSRTPTLSSRYEVTAAADRSGGDFRLYLRLGATSALHPDHVVVIVDRSKSTAPSMHRAAFAMISALFDALPEKTTFDTISFARRPQALIDDSHSKVHDRDARGRLASALDAGARQQGTNLAAAFAMAGKRLHSRGAKRPLIIVVTDGMLPLSITPQQAEKALAEGLGVRAHSRTWPEILFAVDEPMLAQRGLNPDHPVARMAAGLGARISLETLEQKTGSVKDLLSAPQVLRNLTLTLPKHAVLHQAAPAGLVAGNFVVLRGSYRGSRPPQPRIRG
ncbi:MAG TPA: VWA domain-containing protein, partial [Nannocystis exedens]|nr:VWA domain-containing protein [Nannocystis exedens]